MSGATGIDGIRARICRHFELPFSFGGIHGSGECCFENIAFSVGFCCDDAHDSAVLDFFDFYLRKLEETDGVMGSDFVRSFVMNGLLYMGKRLGRPAANAENAFRERLDRVHAFSISNEDIFYSPQEREKIKSVPAVWRDAGIVRYEHVNPFLRLPYVYDLLGFSAMYGGDAQTDARIDGVIDYVLSAGYQKQVENGYGIGINGERGFVKSAFYAVGWDIGLRRLAPRQELLYMLLMSPVAAARRSEWYAANKECYVRAVQTGDEAFINAICSSVRKTYWTSGCYIELGRGKKEKAERLAALIERI